MQWEDIMPFLRQQFEPLGLGCSFYEEPCPFHVANLPLVEWTCGGYRCQLRVWPSYRDVIWMQLLAVPRDRVFTQDATLEDFKTVFIRSLMPMIGDAGSQLYFYEETQ